MTKNKFLILGFVALFLSSAFFMACSKQNEDFSIEETPSSTIIQKSVDAVELSKDQSFIELVAEMNNYNDYLKDIIYKNSLSISDVQISLNELQNKKLSNESRLNEINSIFKSPISERLVSNIRVLSEKWSKLEKKYNNLNEKILTDAYVKIRQKKSSNVQKIMVAPPVVCGWRYDLCLAGSFATAVLCHAGCDTTALATTAGLGIPACVAACGILQVYTSVQCYDAYCKAEPIS
jgi:hypothetical protein